MKITLTNNEVFGIKQILETKFINNQFSSIKTAINIKKIWNAIEAEFKIIEGMRTEIIDPFIPKDKKGKNVVSENGTFKPTDPIKLNEKLKELFDCEVEVEIPNKIDVESLESENIKISIQDLEMLEKILDIK